MVSGSIEASQSTIAATTNSLAGAIIDFSRVPSLDYPLSDTLGQPGRGDRSDLLSIAAVMDFRVDILSDGTPPDSSFKSSDQHAGIALTAPFESGTVNDFLQALANDVDAVPDGTR